MAFNNIWIIYNSLIDVSLVLKTSTEGKITLTLKYFEENLERSQTLFVWPTHRMLHMK